LLKAIDRTVTGAGGRLLAERLMSPLTDPKAIGERLDAVSFFLEEPDLRDALRELLKGVPDMSRALSRLALNRGGPRDLGALSASLEASAASAGLLQVRELPSEIASAVAVLQALPAELVPHLNRA